MVNFDATINLGHVIILIGFAGGIWAVIGVLKDRVQALSNRMSGLEDSMKQLVDVLIAQGRQDERMDGIDQRMTGQASQMVELRTLVMRLYQPDKSVAPYSDPLR